MRAGRSEWSLRALPSALAGWTKDKPCGSAMVSTRPDQDPLCGRPLSWRRTRYPVSRHRGWHPSCRKVLYTGSAELGLGAGSVATMGCSADRPDLVRRSRSRSASRRMERRAWCEGRRGGVARFLGSQSGRGRSSRRPSGWPHGSTYG